eukprot:TRINITY_DN11035_c0_g1_i1.p1 TRINITY_DN11035_c0_g1~~TRINITY_DN11035_c0_g1_i1.p1  ORF type:complete len:281 (+),score=78.05 TRINITY_DN11035_c0_g1_i1:67-843(+)
MAAPAAPEGGATPTAAGAAESPARLLASPSAERCRELAERHGPPLSPLPEACEASEALCALRASRTAASCHQQKVQQIHTELKEQLRREARARHAALAAAFRARLEHEREAELERARRRSEQIERRAQLRAKREAQALQRCKALTQSLMADRAAGAVWRSCPKAWGGWPRHQFELALQNASMTSRQSPGRSSLLGPGLPPREPSRMMYHSGTAGSSFRGKGAGQQRSARHSSISSRLPTQTRITDAGGSPPFEEAALY